MKRLFVLVYLSFLTAIYTFGQNAWINEFHYDNTGTDTNEFVEIVIENPGSYALSDFTVTLYTGNDGTSYDSQALDNFDVGDTEGNYTFYTWYPSSIQNGAPDGLALSYQGTVITGQFLSYEGAFTAMDGPATGMSSTNIGVDEPYDTEIGYSLQLAGTGLQYSDFIWNSPDIETPKSINNCQLLSTTSVVNLKLMISEISDPEDNYNARYVEIYNTGNTPINFCEIG